MGRGRWISVLAAEDDRMGQVVVAAEPFVGMAVVAAVAAVLVVVVGDMLEATVADCRGLVVLGFVV